MHKNLVIVESPAKAKTIENFLGKDYKVLSSYGHIRDLQKKGLGIDMENGFAPIYEIPEDKKKVVDNLKKEADKAEMVWLASDEDREGEAISWHLAQALNLDEKKANRIVFHEITKDAITRAIENPRQIDVNLVDAQQARRILDRIVGFELSPVLWRKVRPSLSAGRVQSVSVRLIVEREREIDGFNAESAYRIIAIFTKEEKGSAYEIKAELNKRPKTKKEALEFLEKLKSAAFNVKSVEVKPTKKSPAAPFTTSTLQQEASRKLGFPVGMTMSVAQKLYESGKITYMRTDSVNLSELAINAAKQQISTAYGKEYSKTRKFTTKSKGAQEAHEAIRPTDLSAQKTTGTPQEKKLYELIWKRTIASQMADAQLERTVININISNSDLHFVAEGEVLKFDGFLHVYLEGTDDEHTEDEVSLLPPVKENDSLLMMITTATERFTQRPARYTEASLVRKMEELGIGRPSTYAPTISTIQNREYVEKSDLEGTERKFNVLTLLNGDVLDKDNTEITGADKNRLIPTDIGLVVNDFLIDFFPGILDYNFTAKVEKEFDLVADGEQNWSDLISQFYTIFHPIVEEAMSAQTDKRVGERVLGTDPKTGRQISVKIGRFGPMVQIGTQEEEEKPLFAGLQKNQSITTISIEEALKLFELPRTLGEYNGKTVSVAVGRFGPYIKHNNLFVSLPKTYDPYTITFEESTPLIDDKIKKEAEKMISTFTHEDEDILILNGRFGPYISYQKNNYKIPKATDPKSLTIEDCLKIIEATPAKAGKKKAATTKAKAKTTTTKKTSTKAKTTAAKTKTTKEKKTTATKKTSTKTGK